MPNVIIPTPFRKFTGNRNKLFVKASTVEETLQVLSTDFPEMQRHLLNSEGKINTFLNVFIGDEDIRDLNYEKTQVSDDAILIIIPPIAGGIRVIA